MRILAWVKNMPFINCTQLQGFPIASHTFTWVSNWEKCCTYCHVYINCHGPTYVASGIGMRPIFWYWNETNLLVLEWDQFSGIETRPIFWYWNNVWLVLFQYQACRSAGRRISKSADLQNHRYVNVTFPKPYRSIVLTDSQLMREKCGMIWCTNKLSWTHLASGIGTINDWWWVSPTKIKLS